MMKKKGLNTTPAGVYNQTTAEIRKKGDDRVLSFPRNKKAAANIQQAIRQSDPNYKESGNQADQTQNVLNTCIKNKSFVRRVAFDSELGTPEIYIW